MKIQEITILTGDLAGTEEFYNQLMEFPVIDKSSASISLQAGKSVLTFTFSGSSSPSYHFAFNIPENKIDEAYAWTARRVSILPFNSETNIADFSNWNAHAFYFHDNQKNILEFIVHHDLMNTSGLPFSSSSITRICEIGVPVDDVTEACNDFLSIHGIPYFEKGPRSKDFAVMGDSNGLLIVTQAGRAWLPTQQPAEKHFTKVLFENKGFVGELIFY